MIYGRAALLRRPDIWAAEHRSPANWARQFLRGTANDSPFPSQRDENHSVGGDKLKHILMTALILLNSCDRS